MPSLFAPAKLTTSLRITGVREDGYHLIDAEMVSLDFGDRIEVTPGGSGFEVDHAEGPTPGDPEDLVCRAVELVGLSARVVLHKSVPAGAGLGGGSSDAAAILRWAGMADHIAASALGADVPFCLFGGRARVSGIGEVVEQLEYVERTVTLFTPPIHCSTPEVYRRWDEMGAPVGSHGNDLEPAAVDLFPALETWRKEFEDATGLRPRLAGSGSTWWVDGDFSGPGRVVARTTPPLGPGA
ncbi:MAG: 4-(cytidine 5'-diphospho)-2-C-methyl-D-erythritol kinase [Microthrixaceae bacterium]